MEQSGGSGGNGAGGAGVQAILNYDCFSRSEEPEGAGRARSRLSPGPGETAHVVWTRSRNPQPTATLDCPVPKRPMAEMCRVLSRLAAAMHPA